MKSCRQDRPNSSGQKHAPVPFCRAEISHGLTWDWNQASALTARRLTAWSSARPLAGLLQVNSSCLTENTPSTLDTNRLVLYREIHKKRINALCWQKAELQMLQQVSVQSSLDFQRLNHNGGKWPTYFDIQNLWIWSRISFTCSRRMRWAGHVARMGEWRGVYRVLVGKPEGKRPLGRPRRRWKDNIKMDLQEVGCGGMTGSSWQRLGTGGGHLWLP